MSNAIFTEFFCVVKDYRRTPDRIAAADRERLNCDVGKARERLDFDDDDDGGGGNNSNEQHGRAGIDRRATTATTSRQPSWRNSAAAVHDEGRRRNDTPPPPWIRLTFDRQWIFGEINATPGSDVGYWIHV